MKKLLLFTVILLSLQASAVIETIKQGSKIIRMNVDSPTTITYNNGAKPFGLMYVLINNFKVPIKWAINPSKVKDGIDFTHNGIAYRSSAFIIPKDFRTTQVDSVITSWVTLYGIQVNTTVSDFQTEIFQTFFGIPKWTLDQDNGVGISGSFWTNASVPTSTYNTKFPSLLNANDDVFVMPHADPTWTDHANLYNWVRTQKGALWLDCHAVSVFENMFNPSAPWQKTNMQSTNGMVDFGDHKDGNPPYTYAYPAEPIMQFMGVIDDATDAGSERVYLPDASKSSTWRPGIKLCVYDLTQDDIPAKSPGPGGIFTFGRAYDTASYGWTFYLAGHDPDNNGSIPERVGCIRAFFSFSFFAANDKLVLPQINGITRIKTGGSDSFWVTTTPVVNLNSFTKTWTKSGGTFTTADTMGYVKWTAPSVTVPTLINLTFTMIDPATRQSFDNHSIVVWPDSDNDGVDDELDPDDDNDGVRDTLEVIGFVDPSKDLDDDQIPNFRDVDFAGCGGLNAKGMCINYDTDGDSLPNHRDLDSDNDGILDNMEAQTTAGYIAPSSTTDANGNGLIDLYDPTMAGANIIPINTDGADEPDTRDFDTDNDKSVDWIDALNDNCSQFVLDDLIARANAYHTAGGPAARYNNSVNTTPANNLPDWMDTSTTGRGRFLDPTNATQYFDTDKDGIVDLFDTNNFGSPVVPVDCNTNGIKDWRDNTKAHILPVVMVNFTATASKGGNAVELNWTTATEVNNSHFEVQRSIDGKEFTNLELVKGAGTSFTSKSYTYTDNSPYLAGVNYYRLRQVDFNGEFSFSEVKTIDLSKSNGSVVISPNPFYNTFEVVINNREYTGADVNVVNMAGQSVFTGSIQCQNSLKIDLSNFSAGVYFVTVNTGSETFTEKIIKK